MSDQLKIHYDIIKKGCVEGIAVLLYIDKCFISSFGFILLINISLNFKINCCS